MKFWFVVWSAVGLLLAGASYSCAEFSLSPKLLVREEFNDNVFLEEADEESDFITYVNPSCSLLWETKVVDLSLDYGLNFKKYLDHDELDETSLRQTQRAKLESTFTLFPEKLFLSVSDVYERVPVDEADAGGLDNQLVNLTDSNRLTVNPYLILQPTRSISSRIEYLYENRWYDDPQGDDAERHTGKVGFTKELTARIDATLSLTHSRYRPDLSEDYDRSDVSLGFAWEISERLSVSGYGGRAWIDFALRDDTEENLFGAEGEYSISEAWSLGAAFDESIDDSVSLGSRKDRNYSAYLRYSNRATADLSVFRREEDYFSIDRDDTSRGVRLSGRLPFSKRTGIDYTADFIRYEKDPDNTDYDRWSGRLGGYYEAPVATLSLGYTYNQNDANTAGDDYTTNIVWAQIHFTF